MLDTSQDTVARAPLSELPTTREDVVSPPFRCTCSRRGVGAAWVTASGDLDLAAVPEFDVALLDALASAQLIVLDLSELSFIDLAGVCAIVDASIRAVCDGGRIMVAFAPVHIERAFTLTGASEAIERLDLNTNDVSARPLPRLVDADSAN